MPEPVKMPALGESVTEGTVTRWLKNEGDRVEENEPLVEVSTDKVDTEIPSPTSGILSRILVPVDEVAEVGTDLALIDGDGSAAPATEEAPAAEQPSAAQAAAEDTAPETARPEATAAPAAGAPAAATEDSVAAQAGEAVRQASPTSEAGTQVTLPALGESVTEGTVTRWLKNVGDQVEENEPLLEISTDKVDTEIPSP